MKIAPIVAQTRPMRLSGGRDTQAWARFAGEDESKAGGNRSPRGPLQMLRAIASRVRPTQALAKPTSLTTVEHEADFKHHVPHHFTVRSAETGEVVAEVHFQEGPVKEKGLNGLQNEDLLRMIITRLKGFQDSPFACQENAEALKRLEEGLAILDARTAKRQSRGVEGKDIA